MAAPTITSYQHDGNTFDVDDSGGDGEVVVLLHGFPQTRRSWKRVTPALVAAGHRVVAPDQRGYSPGARPAGRRAHALDRLVGDVLALADAVGAERFHVVGHDWGGAVGWSLAADHAHRLASFTSLSTPHPRAMVAAMASSTQLLRSWYVAAVQVPVVPEALVRTDLGARLLRGALVRTGLPEDEADADVEMLRDGGAGGALGWYRALPFGAPSAPGPSRVPTLYVYGGGDVALTRRAADLTGRHVDAPYRYEVLAGAGHWLPEAAAGSVGALVVQHVAAHPAAAAAAVPSPS